MNDGPISTPNPGRCPLCGEDNECGMIRGSSACWCQEVVIPREVLERVPPEAQKVACVCRACATGDRTKN